MSKPRKTLSRGAYCTLSPSLDPDRLKDTISHHLLSFLGRDPGRASGRDLYKAFAYTLRDLLIEKWIQTQKNYYDMRQKRVYYLSLEFLVGRSLGNTLINLNMLNEAARVLEQLGYDLEEVREEEQDAALGNGGLGRLAACFMDSLATLKIPAYGYGIRYEFGLFYQRLLNGFQVESPDNWLRYGTPWEFERPEYLYPVQFCGRVKTTIDQQGVYRAEWVDTEIVMAMACDMLVPGYQNDNVINMRLWTARASRELDLSSFNRGDYIQAVHKKVEMETISKLLYPSDDIREGQELRLKQQYFFVAATFQDILRRYKKKHSTFDSFSDKIAVQLNDTHPSIAIPELMRLLVDEEGLDWEKAWDISVKTFGYTNHTLMPEALETWPVDLLGRLLPRHLEIIYEINRRFLEEVAVRCKGDERQLRDLSIIAEGPVKKVRMAHLAIVGSHSVNGVAELHSALLKERLFKGFHEFFPGRFNNKTNGITQRRWLLKSNPGLAALVTETIGDDWIVDLDRLRDLEKMADDPAFQVRWRTAKQQNKVRLAKEIRLRCGGLMVDPDSLFDVHVKRIHEYKRQLLNILRVIIQYHRLLAAPGANMVPRTVIFAGKAAPSYVKAKLIIKLITAVADKVNRDPAMRGRLRVVFLPNYGVSLAEKIIPAADLSEQISTAGTEASGTGNMKLSLNGALTIGTLDGANIEIRAEVGAENFFLFGMTAEEAQQQRQHPKRTPYDVYLQNQEVRAALDQLRDGGFSPDDPGLFNSLVDSLLDPGDPFLALLDLEDYLRCQAEVDRAFLDVAGWTKKTILNVARMGKFSSDRSIREYARDIWEIPVPKS
ncbi:MAG: glycogen phosphorylase [Deltaproteobacteria bacterium CG23_combo_of_CG06-09_8_20_14_all_60_8]|nr:MAG: glycogen phosphorylase [Deltaproteobacteria bacterium CG23_combo_of_CG06-09_8_20_14_all_60_8]